MKTSCCCCLQSFCPLLDKWRLLRVLQRSHFWNGTLPQQLPFCPGVCGVGPGPLTLLLATQLEEARPSWTLEDKVQDHQPPSFISLVLYRLHVLVNFWRRWHWWIPSSSSVGILNSWSWLSAILVQHLSICCWLMPARGLLGNSSRLTMVWKRLKVRGGLLLFISIILWEVTCMTQEGRRRLMLQLSK